MRKRINLFWYKMPNGQKNFGDELGPYIVKKLSGCDVNYVPIINKLHKIPYLLLRGLLKGKYKFKDLGDIVKNCFISNALVTVGSIIAIPDSPKVDIWGSGIMHRYDPINKANFHAVRGKYTQLRIKELGFVAPNALGDPALLLPLILTPKVTKSYRLGIIPHYIHYLDATKKFKGEDVLIINLLDDINKVVSDILSCEFTISTSLHGIITSHAYGVPCLWFNLFESKLAGDNIKFKDYFSSVNIEEYEPLCLEKSSSDKIVDEVLGSFEINRKRANINVNLRNLQRGLLEAAPFPLCDEYKNK